MALLKSQIKRRDSLVSWLGGLLYGKFSSIFFKLVNVFYKRPYFASEPLNIKKLLIVSDVDGLGDAILFRRVLESIIDKYEIFLLIKPYHLSVYKDIISKDHIFLIENTASLFFYLNKFRKYNFDCLLLHRVSIRSFLGSLLFFRKIKKIGVFVPQGLKFNKNFNAEEYKNVLELYINLASYLGGNYKFYSFNSLKRTDVQSLDAFIHIGSGSLCKNWRIKNFINLAKMFNQAGISYKIVGGELDFKIFSKSKYKDQLKIIIPKSFEELAGLVSVSKLVICHNTSILHLAATLGVSTISLNCDRDYNWWDSYKNSPYFKEQHIAFNAQIGKTCGYKEQITSLFLEKKQYGCPLFDFIKPESIFQASLKLLKK